MSPPLQPLRVFARWRPLMTPEEAAGGMTRAASLEDSGLYSISIDHPSHRLWKSTAAFSETYEPPDTNARVFDSVVSDALPKVLKGACCNFFAYGHTGSGKTHTIIGYDYDQDEKLGLCLTAARRLFESLDKLNDEGAHARLGIGFSLFELRNKTAIDLLNGCTECHVRQGPDGKTHIRGPTEMLDGGRVRVRPIVKRTCWTYESLKEELRASVGLRAVGASTVHDQSSRTHAVLELEVVNAPLTTAREALIERQSELVPVGKRATDIRVEEETKSVIIRPGGGWEPNPNYQINRERVDKVMTEMAEYEARVTEAEEHIASLLSSDDTPACVGGKLVFVDLTGSEYQQDKLTSAPLLSKQTPQERQEGRQINSDLLALKEVIRAVSSHQSRIPFRSSPLTMVLREHFLGSRDGASAMIVTVSPAKEQYAATLNTLKYGSLVGAAAA